jgi:hypothetical protein
MADGAVAVVAVEDGAAAADDAQNADGGGLCETVACRVCGKKIQINHDPESAVCVFKCYRPLRDHFTRAHKLTGEHHAEEMLYHQQLLVLHRDGRIPAAATPLLPAFRHHSSNSEMLWPAGTKQFDSGSDIPVTAPASCSMFEDRGILQAYKDWCMIGFGIATDDDVILAVQRKLLHMHVPVVGKHTSVQQRGDKWHRLHALVYEAVMRWHSLINTVDYVFRQSLMVFYNPGGRSKPFTSRAADDDDEQDDHASGKSSARNIFRPVQPATAKMYAKSTAHMIVFIVSFMIEQDIQCELADFISGHDDNAPFSAAEGARVRTMTLNLMLSIPASCQISTQSACNTPDVVLVYLRSLMFHPTLAASEVVIASPSQISNACAGLFYAFRAAATAFHTPDSNGYARPGSLEHFATDLTMSRVVVTVAQGLNVAKKVNIPRLKNMSTANEMTENGEQWPIVTVAGTPFRFMFVRSMVATMTSQISSMVMDLLQPPNMSSGSCRNLLDAPTCKNGVGLGFRLTSRSESEAAVFPCAINYMCDGKSMQHDADAIADVLNWNESAATLMDAGERINEIYYHLITLIWIAHYPSRSAEVHVLLGRASGRWYELCYDY